MHNIALSDEMYQSIAELASERGQTIEELLSNLIAQARWEEHAAQAYDAHHARAEEPHESLTEEEFLQSLQEQPASSGESDADL